MVWLFEAAGRRELVEAPDRRAAVSQWLESLRPCQRTGLTAEPAWERPTIWLTAFLAPDPIGEEAEAGRLQFQDGEWAFCPTRGGS